MSCLVSKVARSRWYFRRAGRLGLPLIGAAGGLLWGAIWGGVWGFGAPALADLRGELADGTMRTGTIVGDRADALLFVPADSRGDAIGARIPLASLRRIHLEARPRTVSAIISPRHIEFCGGERLHVGLEGVDAAAATISACGRAAVSLPRGVVSCLLQPSGGRIVAVEDFEGRSPPFAGARLSAARQRSGKQSLSRRPGDSPISIPVESPLSTGRIELSFFDSGEIDRGEEWLIELEMGEGEAAAVARFCPGWSAPEYRCEMTRGGPLAAQRVGRPPGWRRLTFLFEPQRLLVLVDDTLVGASAAPGRPTALRIVNRSTEEGAASRRVVDQAKSGPIEGWIDDLEVTEQVPVANWPINTQPSDLLWLATDDEVYGDVVAADRHSAQLDGPFVRRKFPWRDLNGIVFRRHAAPPGKPVRGVVARIDLAPILGADGASPDWLVASLARVSETELLAAHPYLGDLRIPLREIDRIEPYFEGELRMIDPMPHHLGNEIREDFSTKLPEGSRLERSFRLESIPEAGVFVSCQAVDLEPNKSQNQRFREQLAGGHLRTELFVNGKRVTDLNGLIAWRGVPSHPLRMRVPVPTALLRKGENTLRIEQRPTSDDPQEFDDCEITRLALEIEAVKR